MAYKILFMGTPDFAVPILKSINDSNHKVLEVYTQPPQKKNRGQKLSLSPIHLYSNKLNIKVRNPSSLDSKEELEHIQKLNPDIVIVVAYGKILPTSFLDLQNIKFINIHASLLPKWRGAAPIQRAIMNRDKETGVSIMKIVSKLDAGPVLIKSKLKIFKETNFRQLSEQMSNLGATLILEAMELIKKKKAVFINQIENEATYAKKINKLEAKINWNDKAKEVIAKINALHPNPGSWFKLLGSRIKVIKANEIKINGKPGEIIDNDFTVACSENAVQILELQKEGKQIMNAREYLKGNKLEIGSNLIKDV
jgi:methionyl-tRNA formyltransferase